MVTPCLKRKTISQRFRMKNTSAVILNHQHLKELTVEVKCISQACCDDPQPWSRWKMLQITERVSRMNIIGKKGKSQPFFVWLGDGGSQLWETFSWNWKLKETRASQCWQTLSNIANTGLQTLLIAALSMNCTVKDKPCPETRPVLPLQRSQSSSLSLQAVDLNLPNATPL